MNIQELFVKVSSSVRSQTKPVNSGMHELDKEQSSNCNVHTGLILDSQDSSCSKTIAVPSVSETTAPPSVSETTAPPSVSKTIAPPSVLKTIAPPSSQHQSINTAALVSETPKHSWFVKPKREELSEYFKFYPFQSRNN